MPDDKISLFTPEQYRELQQVIETRVTDGVQFLSEVQLAGLKAHVDHELGILRQTINHRLEEVGNGFHTLQNRLDETDSRLGDIEQRLRTVETRLDSIETRLGRVETRLEAMETRLEAMTKSLEQLNSRLDSFEKMLNKTQEPSTVVMELGTWAGKAHLSFADHLVDHGLKLVWLLVSATCIHLFFTSEEWVTRRNRRWKLRDAKDAKTAEPT
ncbi:hypothetical protein BDZ91DRAFT_793900 [Kalaharituber pfeilii]|nr:hypothetical protein BDZ91DRAFT_793900 [Kalaharituber pfeilii]